MLGLSEASHGGDKQLLRSTCTGTAVMILATESALLETFQNCWGFTDVVLKTESCIMRANFSITNHRTVWPALPQNSACWGSRYFFKPFACQFERSCGCTTTMDTGHSSPKKFLTCAHLKNVLTRNLACTLISDVPNLATADISENPNVSGIGDSAGDP